MRTGSQGRLLSVFIVGIKTVRQCDKDSVQFPALNAVFVWLKNDLMVGFAAHAGVSLT